MGHLVKKYYFMFIFHTFQKLDLGACSKIHDPALKADYELAISTDKSKDYDYEIEVCVFLYSKLYSTSSLIICFYPTD